VVLFFVTVKRFLAVQDENRRQAPLQVPTLKRPDSGGILHNQLAESAWISDEPAALEMVCESKSFLTAR
jgi:hypothetical protein